MTPPLPYPTLNPQTPQTHFEYVNHMTAPLTLAPCLSPPYLMTAPLTLPPCLSPPYLMTAPLNLPPCLSPPYLMTEAISSSKQLSHSPSVLTTTTSPGCRLISKRWMCVCVCVGGGQLGCRLISKHGGGGGGAGRDESASSPDERYSFRVRELVSHELQYESWSFMKISQL